MASVLLCLFAGAAQAGGDGADGGDGQALPGDFLVFLAEWEDPDGNWQDPLEFDDPKWRALDDEAEWQHDTD